MSAERAETGSMVWIDLTVPNAENVRDFYSEVVGWTPAEVDLGGYSDFHARGVNEGMPPAWMPYFTVADLDASIGRCEKFGGEVVVPPRGLGEGRFCVVRDPAGAVAALFQQ